MSLLIPLIVITTVKQCDFGTLPDYLTSLVSGYTHISHVVVTPQATPDFLTQHHPARFVIEAASNFGSGVIVENLGRIGTSPPANQSDLRPMALYVWGIGFQTFRVALQSNPAMYYIDEKVQFT